MKTVPLPHLVAVALAAGATGAFLSAIVLKGGDTGATPVSLGDDGTPTSATASRFDALDESLARIDLRLTALELVDEPTARVPASGYVTRDELDALLAEALADMSAAQDVAAATGGASEPNALDEQKAAKNAKLDAFLEGGEGKPTPDRAEVLETLTAKYTSWLDLDAVQREAMLGALVDQEARREEIRRLAAEGADYEYLGQLKGENTQAFQAVLTSILTPEQLETMNAANSGKQW